MDKAKETGGEEDLKDPIGEKAILLSKVPEAAVT